jgi:hypothetical protein
LKLRRRKAQGDVIKKKKLDREIEIVEEEENGYASEYGSQNKM